jgi:hypothetical protein
MSAQARLSDPGHQFRGWPARDSAHPERDSVTLRVTLSSFDAEPDRAVAGRLAALLC